MSTIPQPLEVRMLTVGPWPMNSYVIVDPESRESVLVDPGAEPDTLAAALRGSVPTAILLTHTHPDHIGALDAMQERLGVPVYAHPGPRTNPVARSLTPDHPLHNGDRFPLGAHQLQVLHTPGHTDDMLTFLLPGRWAIVGDTIFAGGPGRTWSPQDFQTTLHTLQSIVLAWSDDTICYPGHGPAFRLGDQRPAIVRFLAADHGAFHGNAEWNM